MLLQVWTLLVLTSTCYTTASDDDLRFIGSAYDLVRGNPDGASTGSRQSTDPGILVTRKVVLPVFTTRCPVVPPGGRITCDGASGGITKEQCYALGDCCFDSSLPNVPHCYKKHTADVTFNNVVIIQRDSCVSVESVYENTKSYQTKLQDEFEGEIARSSFFGSSFRASAGFKVAEEETTETHNLVFETSRVCLKTEVRYQKELANALNFHITDSFASEICALPPAYNSGSKTAYMEYLRRWGTHVITKVNLGTKHIERKQTSSVSVLQFAQNEKDFSVEYDGSIGSFKVDINKYREEQSFKSLFKSNLISYEIGSDDLPEPIKLELHEITEFLQEKYWGNLADLKSKSICPAGFDISTINTLKTEMGKALPDYPDYLQAAPVQDAKVTVPLQWPKGTFGLVRVDQTCAGDFGCPTGAWWWGKRMHDTQSENNQNSITSGHCIDAFVDSSAIVLNFCMQHTANRGYNLEWPRGSYCLFKKGDCPPGFEVGSSRWDDEDNSNNNERHGHLPDGVYNQNTIYYFCCRKDNFPTEKIYLPTEKPFYLLAATRHCQLVHGMTATEHYIFWDDEDTETGNHEIGMVPYNFDAADGDGRDHNYLFCYYKKD